MLIEPIIVFTFGKMKFGRNMREIMNINDSGIFYLLIKVVDPQASSLCKVSLNLYLLFFMLTYKLIHTEMVLLFMYNLWGNQEKSYMELDLKIGTGVCKVPG